MREALQTFADERDWQQFHTPKNLAMASSDAPSIAEHIQRDGDRCTIPIGPRTCAGT